MRKLTETSDGIEMEIDLPPPITGDLATDIEETEAFIVSLQNMCATLTSWVSTQPDFKLQGSEVAYAWTLRRLLVLRGSLNCCETSDQVEAIRTKAQEVAQQSEQIDTLLHQQPKMERMH